ncbi:glycosyltransferase [Euzebya sp.]|uniref:glycosyltransferase n=1 Tax=Euzebya sp. TaxID=1971409 RepID=UPI0035198927
MTRSLPTVTVVIINYNGGDFLLPCLQSVLDQDYPADRVEVLLIDNHSTDGSLEKARAQFPTIRIVENERNGGFAPVVNQGARLGRGEYVALLNTDAVADPTWLRELILPLVGDPRIKVTGGLLLDDTGTRVDFAGGVLAFYGQGFIPHRGEAPPADLRRRPSIFVCGASMAMPRKWFLEVGGFDEDFFAFVEDVDFGWRTWVLGGEVWFIPESVARHRHHGTIERFGHPREQYLIERNALASVFKNFDDDNLARTLPSSLMLSLLRGFHDERSELGDYRISEESAGTPPPEPVVSSLTGAHMAAIRDFGLMLEKLRHKRAFIQDNRQRPDADVFRLFDNPVAANVVDPVFTSVFHQVIDAFDMSWPGRSRQRVLILTADPLGAKMAGPAIRVWEMARALSAEHDVLVASTHEPQTSAAERAASAGRSGPAGGQAGPAEGRSGLGGFRLGHIDDSNARRLADWADVIVTQGFMLHFFPQLARSEAAIVVDIYDPFHIEALVMRKDLPPEERWNTMNSDADVVNAQLERGDLLLCASESQRDFWLGQLASLKRINPATYDEDPDLRRLLTVVPFGLPAEPPVQTRRAIRDTTDGIGDDDIVLLWGGGIYNWFDPATLIRGLHTAIQSEPRLKLYFLGTAHPNPAVPEMARLSEAHRVAEELDLLGTHVFFNSGWVDYDDRANYLLDADIGVSTHFLHLETKLSFRTRILDYLWAGLPILTTGGDLLSGLVTTHGLGEVVEAEDPDAIAGALLRLADPSTREGVRANVTAFAPTMTWDRALEPLVEFCRFPRRAPDLRSDEPRYLVRRDRNRLTRRSPRDLVRKFQDFAAEQGVRGAVAEGVNSLRVRLAARRARAQAEA